MQGRNTIIESVLYLFLDVGPFSLGKFVVPSVDKATGRKQNYVSEGLLLQCWANLFRFKP